MSEDNLVQPVSASPPLPPPHGTAGAAQPVLAYATPFGIAAPAFAAWRDGNRLVTVTRGSLPQQCVKCAAPADGFYGPRTFYWHHPALVLLVLLGMPGLIALVIVALVTRKGATLDIGLCAAHRARRRTAIVATWFLVIAGIAAIVCGLIAMEEYRSDWAPLFGTLTALALWIVAAVVYTKLGTYLSPTKIDATYATFKGAGVEFLSQFPPVR